MKRTGWYSAQSQPPVNGGPDDVYERRCQLPVYANTPVWRSTKKQLENNVCPHCQWRGLTKPAKEK